MFYRVSQSTTGGLGPPRPLQQPLIYIRGLLVSLLLPPLVLPKTTSPKNYITQGFAESLFMGELN